MKLYFDNDEIPEGDQEAAWRRLPDHHGPARDEALARLRAELRRETGG